MLKTLSVLLTLAFLSSPAYSQKDKYVVRKVNWGMTHAQVKAAETWKIVNVETKAITYTGFLLGYPCTLIYSFKDNGRRLKAVSYGFRGAKDLSLFRTLMDLLTKKYGDPHDLVDRTSLITDVLLIWLVKETETTIALSYEKSISLIYLHEKHDEKDGVDSIPGQMEVDPF